MAKRSYVSDDIRASLEEADFEITAFTDSKPEYAWLISLVPGVLKVGGLPSGNDYVFSGPGIEVKVLSEDASVLLAKRRGGCCGGSPYPMFEEVY